jgi:hypothetical protein
MSTEKKQNNATNEKLAKCDENQLSQAELEGVSGGMQWEYTKQDDTGAAKGTVATKVNLAKGAGAS